LFFLHGNLHGSHARTGPSRTGLTLKKNELRPLGDVSLFCPSASFFRDEPAVFPPLPSPKLAKRFLSKAFLAALHNRHLVEDVAFFDPALQYLFHVGLKTPLRELPFPRMLPQRPFGYCCPLMFCFLGGTPPRSGPRIYGGPKALGYRKVGGFF